ncbi:hypothetical protein FRC12_015459 [Ceratobasidium sp. 428]|nr:hypothetical protein FRC12_015459 [Ceratobasidium sp. 428]
MEPGQGLFPADAIARARELYDEIDLMDTYSHSQGVLFIRESVTKSIGEGRRLS